MEATQQLHNSNTLSYKWYTNLIGYMWWEVTHYDNVVQLW